MSENGIKTEVIRNKDGTFAEGTSPGPGRTPGSISIKEQIRKRLEEKPEELKEIVEYFVKNNRELMWQMLEGRPQQDVTSDGKAPTILLNGSANLS